ncbi:MAG: radical SAM protein, partial [Candidatus Omnitrophica bacterium]|nr:radical SAM protein [Candidatus Omnitrophota bacterium]
MKITLISPYPDITSFGMRTLSAYLKEKGFPTNLIFLPDTAGDELRGEERPRYRDEDLNKLIPLCADSGLIGISLMTNYFSSAVQITERLKSKLKIPIIWGGCHPTIRPEECLKYADIVCVGEGENAILRLCQSLQTGKPYKDLANLWIRDHGKIKKNAPGPLIQNLDLLPHPDYSLKEHYILKGNKIVPFNSELLKQFLAKGTISEYLRMVGYQTMSSRGCPHRCSYCVNWTWKKLYENERYLRWRSSESIIQELERAKELMPFLDLIWFSDDSFFSRNIKSIREFGEKYQKRINLPFFCLTSPLTITEEKMSCLVDAGLICIQMGIETGSKRIQKLFHRENFTNSRMLKGTYIINRYREKMKKPLYDFLLDIPTETEEDKMETLKFISRIPRPFRLQLFSLVLYPGTELYNLAEKEGLIKDEKKQIYNKSYAQKEENYLNLFLVLF